MPPMPEGDGEKEKIVNPAEREAAGLSRELSHEEESEYVAVVDERLKEETIEDKRRRESTEYEAAAFVNVGSGPVVERLGNRTKLRVLMITTDPTLCVAGSPAQAQYQSYAGLFQELHVIVVTHKKHGFSESMRITDNLFVYPTNSHGWPFAVYDAYRIAGKQLTFGGGFRADVVIVHDLFEAGLAGYVIARKYDRALQAQLYHSPFDEYILETQTARNWRTLIAHFLVKRITCIRVTSDMVKEDMVHNFAKAEPHITVLPIYRDLSHIQDAVPTFNLHERYPQFKFIMLVISSLRERQRVSQLIQDATFALQQYKSVGMVIVGSGPLLSQLEEQVAQSGLSGSVVFEQPQVDTVSHLKTADLLLNAADTDESNQVLVEAALAGVPVLTVATETANDLFTDRESGFLCPADDPTCIPGRIGEFLSDNQLRRAFAITIRDRAKQRISQDPGQYIEDYLTLIEQCMLKKQEERAS